MKKPGSTLTLTLTFWSDGLDPQQHTAWASGTVYVKANKALGVKPGLKFFRSVADIGTVVEQLLMEREVTLRPGTERKALYP